MHPDDSSKNWEGFFALTCHILFRHVGSPLLVDNNSRVLVNGAMTFYYKLDFLFISTFEWWGPQGTAWKDL